jgi:phospholipid/cholesterol/gamma-HCH transport system ATP-binding protein
MTPQEELAEPAWPEGSPLATEPPGMSSAGKSRHRPPVTDPVLEFRHISRRFGSQEVLREVSFQIQRNETIAIIGESGCGKSVTLKLMIGLMQPSSGTVFLDGKPHRERTEDEWTRERLRFGFLFQGAALFDSLSVYENVAFGLRQNTDWGEDEIADAVSQRLHEVGLPPTAARKMPSELSGGMRKRVGLARALALAPEIMMYDEPTTGLDPIMSDVINELILQTRQNRPLTSIVITHDMVTVGRVADRVLMFYPRARLKPDEPQIIFDGTPQEAFTSSDPRVYQFCHGQAGERIREMTAA